MTIGIIFSFCLPNVDTKYRLDIDKAKKLDWYKSFISELNTENKIDRLDAIIFKGYSSNLYTSAVEDPDTIVKRFGKLNETDIKILYNIVENGNTTIYAITEHYPFNHLYKYIPSKNKLELIKNKNVIICSGDEDLVLINNNDSTMTFWAKRKNDKENKEGVTKYFVYNKINRTLCHHRNCKTIDNKEDCIYIKEK